MLGRAPLQQSSGSCLASAHSRCGRGFVCYRPARCTAVRRQQLLVQATHTPPPPLPPTPQPGAPGAPPPALPQLPATPTANNNNNNNNPAWGYTGRGAPPQTPKPRIRIGAPESLPKATVLYPSGQAKAKGVPGQASSPPVPQGQPRQAIQPRGVFDGGRPYDPAVMSAEAERFAQPKALSLFAWLPLAIILGSDSPSTVVNFLRMFPLFMHNSIRTGISQGGSAVNVAVGCVVAGDPAALKDGSSTSGKADSTLCAAPWTANFMIGTVLGISWAPLLGSSKHYAWGASTITPAHCVNPTFTGPCKDLKIFNNCLNLAAYALPPPDTTEAVEKQVRLAVIPSIDAESQSTVVCWGLAKGTQGAPDKLLVAVLDAQTADQAWQVEDLVYKTPIVRLQCGTDTIQLDTTTCLLGPRTYVAAQAQDRPSGIKERLTVVGVWHDKPTPGWRLYAQVRSLAPSLDAGVSSLVGAAQLSPLGESYGYPPNYKRATSLLEALSVPPGQESYLQQHQFGPPDKWELNVAQSNPAKYAMVRGNLHLFTQELDGYSKAVGSKQPVNKASDSRGTLDAKNVNQ